MEYAIASEQGKRPTMEDKEIIHPLPQLNGHLIGLFDGHGGVEVSHLAQMNIPGIFSWRHSISDRKRPLGEILTETGVDFDRKLYNINPGFVNVGTTSLVALITPAEIHVANCGDSRAIIFDASGHLIGRTQDHKPNAMTEGHRILGAGGKVFMGRINGVLSVSRGFGDFAEGLKVRKGQYLGPKAPLSPVADVYVFQRVPSLYLLMACDGLWDVMNSEEVSLWISLRLHSKKLDEIVKELVTMAIGEKGSTDNVTAILVKL